MQPLEANRFRIPDDANSLAQFDLSKPVSAGNTLSKSVKLKKVVNSVYSPSRNLISKLTTTFIVKETLFIYVKLKYGHWLFCQENSVATRFV